VSPQTEFRPLSYNGAPSKRRAGIFDQSKRGKVYFVKMGFIL
jgi:hypothetical protein